MIHTTRTRRSRVVAVEVVLVLLTAVLLPLVGLAPARAGVPPRSTFGVGYAITSDSGRYSARLQADGNVVVSDSDGRVVWHSATYGTPGGVLAFQADGNLVAYGRNGRALWHTDTWGQGARSVLVSNDGRLVVTGPGGNTLWSTPTDDGTSWQRDSMGTFEDLTAGQSLVSTYGGYRFAMQADGNAVVYGPGNAVLWHSGTFGEPGSRLRVQSDGNLVVYAPNRRPGWYSGTSGGYTRLAMQDDGNLVLYSDGRALWSSTYGRTG